MGAVPNSPHRIEIQVKRVELRTVPITILGEESDFEYKAMLQVLLENPANPQQGAGIAEVRRCIKLLDLLDTPGGEIVLEDADFQFLLERVRGTKFTHNNRAFVEFVDYFEKVAESE